MEKDLKSIKNLLRVFLLIIVIYLLFLLKAYLIPVALALFFAVLLVPVIARLQKWKIPLSVSVATVSLAFLGIIFLFGLFISQMARRLISESGELKAQISEKVRLMDTFLLDASGGQIRSEKVLGGIQKIINPDFIFQYSGDVAGFVGGFTADFFLMFLYMVGFLSAIQNYQIFLRYLSGDSKILSSEKVVGVFEEIKTSLSTYMVVKFLISLGTGAGYAIVCYIFGIKHAIIWGFLAFSLNFIPTIGSIFATIPPILLAIIQFDSPVSVLLLILILMGVQTFFGNVLEPKIQGSNFNINFVSIILGLVLFGGLWGIVGMLLSVPLLVLVKVISSQIPDAEFLVRLMSTQSEVNKWANNNPTTKISHL